MSARSRERWARHGLVGQLSAAYMILRNASEAKHLTPTTRANASKAADLAYKVLVQAKAETTEPTELSAKKGT